MKALLKARPEPGATLAWVDIPAIGPNDVLVKIEVASICGTDLHIYEWDNWAQNRIKPPRIFGHELAGRVVELGANVTSLQAGDFVAAETHVVCGHCALCRTGQAHICSNVAIFGVDTDGTFAEYVRVPASNAWKTDPAVGPEVAAMQEPFGNAVHTVLSGEIATARVAVFGCGPTGLAAIAVARACGATAIYAVDVNDYRLDLAMEMGATRTLKAGRDDIVAAILAATGGEGVDVSLEMSGAAIALRQSFEVLRNGGRVSILGIPSRPVELDWANLVVFKGATIHGIAGRRMYDTWQKTKALVESGIVDVRKMITHRFALEDYEEGFALMKSGNSGKIALYPGGLPAGRS
jgi:threonine 3-dehydrogenase